MASLKVRELHSLLESFVEALEANKADSTATRGIHELCAMFSGNDNMTVTAFLGAIERAAPAVRKADGPILASVIPALRSLRMFMDGVAKKDLNDGLDSLLDILQLHADSAMSVFVTNAISASTSAASTSKPKRKSRKVAASMDERLVDDYVTRLEAALGDDSKFESLLAEINADTRVQQAEAVAIASRFYKKTAKSTSRPKALERIRERQEKLMKFKRQPSTAGRPAA